MSDFVLHNARVILPDRVVHGGVVARGGRIVQVFTEDSKPAGMEAVDRQDAGGRYLAPGFIDIHIHGSAGVDVQDTDKDGLTTLSRYLSDKGVIGYFATFVPADSSSLVAALGRIASYAENGDADGARILGVHFEGPFVSKKRCGALHVEHFKTYDGDPRSVDVFAGQVNRSGNRSADARLITVAPELDGAISLIQELTGRGVRC